MWCIRRQHSSALKCLCVLVGIGSLVYAQIFARDIQNSSPITTPKNALSSRKEVLPSKRKNYNKLIDELRRKWCTWWQYAPEAESEVSSSTCVSASLILFGVPKEFSHIWKNYLKYIVNQNPKIQFEAHMHMYSDLSTNFNNAKNNESNTTTESLLDVERILIKGMGPMNVTIPTKLVTSPQKKYDETELMWIEERDTKSLSHLTIDTLKNIFRQGNSLQQAYISASSHSLLQNMTAKKMDNKIYIFLRSDTLLISPIDISCSGMATNELHIPSWQTKGHPEYNDRAAMAGSAAAYIYAKAKSDIFREMIIDRRNEKGEEKLKWASAAATAKLPQPWTWPWQLGNDPEKLHNPEKMLKLYLDNENDGDVKLTVKERELSWAKLIRIRSNGILEDAGRWGVKQKLLSEITLRRR